MGQLVPARNRDSQTQIVASDTGSQQYLTFKLGGEMFAVGILNVKEIIEFGSITEIPMMPSFIRGVINLRGSVVPVIDLSARFGNKATEVGKRTCIVIVEAQDGDTRHDIGVIVDAVSEVLEIPPAEIEPPPSFGAKIRADFIFGMGKAGRKAEDAAGQFVIILNIERVLSTAEMAVLSGVAGAGAEGAA